MKLWLRAFIRAELEAPEPGAIMWSPQYTGHLQITVRSVRMYAGRHAMGWTSLSAEALKMPRATRRRLLAWCLRDCRATYQGLIRDGYPQDNPHRKDEPI